MSDLPDNFIEQVKAALEKLYDFKALQENDLIKTFSAQLYDAHVASVHKLRSLLIESIETLNHDDNVTSQSGTARIYHLIYMHYVSKMTIQQIAWEVGISLRQAYRDLRRGQELVSAVLWQKLHLLPTPQQKDDTFQEELVRLGDTTSVTVLQEMLDNATRAVEVLAEKHGTRVNIQASAQPIMMTTNPVIAQQVLTHLLSQIIQQLKPTVLDVYLADEECFARFRYTTASNPDLQIKSVITQLMDKINWKLDYHVADGMAEICLQVSQQRILIALIDDNDGLVELLQRYLPDKTYTVMPVPNTESGLEIIQQLQPDVILLDLMMPDMDGWEVLQRLRTQRLTQQIPVIICSVINDPELAFSLGASQYVPKPVTREALFQALHELELSRHFIT